MEKIKKALEKARHEKTTGGPDKSNLRINATSKISPTIDRIEYTQTQTVEASRDKLRENHVISELGPCAFVDAYRILRTHVLHGMYEQGWNTLAITSAQVNEGKTLTAINLAISISLKINQTVLLVDANLRHPSVHAYFDLKPKYDLSDYIAENVPLQEILIHPSGFGRLVILPGKKSLSNSSEMLSSPKMVDLVEELKTRYPSRIVLFDLPPLLEAADALAFLPYVDASLLVIEDEKTTREQIKDSVELLEKKRFLGLVLNKAKS